MMNFDFFKNFVCFYCGEAPAQNWNFQTMNRIDVSEFKINNIMCTCKKLDMYHDKGGISLIFALTNELHIWIDVSEFKTDFTIIDIKGNKYDNTLLRLNYIPNFIKSTIEKTIEAIETLIIFR